MTIGSPKSGKEKKSRKSKQVVEEKVPLLPSKKEEDVGFDEFNGASFTGAVFNLSTTIVGAGIMALPATMKVLGLVLGIAMIIFVAFLTEASIEMLLRFSRVGNTTSYGGVMGDAFGKCGRIFLQICVLVNNIGVLIVYMIIIGDVLSGTTSSGIHHAGVLEGWFGESWWNGHTFVLLITTLFVFAPLACLKRIDSLKFTSALSVALAVVFLVVTVGITVTKLINGSISMPRLLPDITDLTSFLNLFTAVPVLVTAYICHYNVHSIDNELEDNTQIKAVVRSSLALCSTVYVMTSLFGFLLFGDETLDDVLSNFDADLGIPYGSLLNDIVRVSYAAHLMLVFPIVFYPLRLNLDGLFFPSAMPLALDNLRFTLISSGLLTLVFVGANFIPSIWDAFQFTGATAAVCLGFIFPAAITLRDRHSIATKKDKILCIFMIVLAVFSNVVAIYSDAYALFKKNGSSRKDTRLGNRNILLFASSGTIGDSGMDGKDEKRERDELAESLNDLSTSFSTMIKADLQGTNNILELMEKMNLSVAEEYKSFGGVVSGLRVFVEQLKSKSGSFDEYVQQIDAIEQQVTELEAVISMLDKYVYLLESKLHHFYQVSPL
ncbi:transmembrane amino acid transporter family protein [Actinidia rufa]|uniref:Transmembrane amino acid transporter family protein n=1 Tax=Actinidia rufa TaxID=165716 RepID=A0A7J0E8U5_9ERIC|nr:transmembrane amino acid transporter family protein [Actinidia rufa]